MPAHYGTGKHCYPLNQDARRRWHDAQAGEIPSHPPPEVVARDAQPHEVPTGAKRMLKAAQGAGWRARAVYARGTSMTARGTPGRVVDSVLVAALRGSAYLVATWVDGVFDLAYIRAVGEHPRKVGARAARAFIDSPLTEQEAAA
jgi:hypothetical protein